jgi:hypothetical protein
MDWTKPDRASAEALVNSLREVVEEGGYRIRRLGSEVINYADPEPDVIWVDVARLHQLFMEWHNDQDLDVEDVVDYADRLVERVKREATVKTVETLQP